MDKKRSKLSEAQSAKKRKEEEEKRAKDKGIELYHLFPTALLGILHCHFVMQL